MLAPFRGPGYQGREGCMLVTISDARALDTVSHFILCSSLILAIGFAVAWTSQCIFLPSSCMVIGNDAVHLPLGTAQGHRRQSGAKGRAWNSSHLFASQTKDPILGNTGSKYPHYKIFFVIQKMLGEKTRSTCQSKLAHGSFVPWRANACATSPDEAMETIACLGAYSFQGATNPSAMWRAFLRM